MAYLDNNGVLYLWGKIKAHVSSAVAGLYTKPSGGIPASDLAAGVIPDISGKVDKITGYGLAKITENEGNYNLSVREGENAAKNALVVSAGTFATAMQQASQAIAAKANTADVYTKTEIDGKLTNAYVYKGSVATVSDLPSSDVGSGWVYNVEASGMNYAWNGSAWDALGETFSITAITNAEIDTICT